MLGAILGDMIGAPYERAGLKRADFPLFGPRTNFTDDTVLTVATADSLLRGRPYRESYRAWRAPPWIPTHKPTGTRRAREHGMSDDRARVVATRA